MNNKHYALIKKYIDNELTQGFWQCSEYPKYKRRAGARQTRKDIINIYNADFEQMKDTLLYNDFSVCYCLLLESINHIKELEEALQ